MSEVVNLGNSQIKFWNSIPIDLDPLKSRAMWQGATYAENPLTKEGYIYQMQAVPLKGDVEDIWIHVFKIVNDKPKYQWSTELPGIGHTQTLHVIISPSGQHWAYLGVDEYNGNSRSITTKAWQVRLRRAKVNVRTDSSSVKINTGPGSVQVVGNFDGTDPNFRTLVLRRANADFETYEWHSFNELMAWNGDARPKPAFSLRIPKPERGGTYQSACATGNYKNAAAKARVYRINGATSEKTIVYRFKLPLPLAPVAKILSQPVNGREDAAWDISKFAPDAAQPVSTQEGEAIFKGPGGIIFAGLRCNSVRRRFVYYGRFTKAGK